MGRAKTEPTKVERVPLADARKIRAVAKKLDIPFKDAFRRMCRKNIERVHRRIMAGELVELGENGAG